MTTKRDGSKSLTLKKPSDGRKAPGRRGKGDPPILRLPLEGRVKRADIRRAVLAVRDEKIAVNGDI
jgi:hypothetical protein